MAVKNSNTKKNQDFVVSYAQNREDIILESFFPDLNQGVYVDIGANHPFYHSVTKILYDKGWTGINVEPNPMLLEQISEHRPKDINLGIGVGEKNGEMDLRIYHSLDGLEGISTLSESMKEDYSITKSRDTKKYTDLRIEVKTLKQIFKEHKLKKINILKVDVEGFEYEVLSGNDWHKFRPELICIESNHIVKDWRPILKKADYHLVFNDGINDYYLAQESMHREKHFDYAELFLSSKPVIEFHLSEKIRTMNEAIDYYKAVEKGLHDVIRQREDKIQQYEELINEITPLRKHIRRQVRAKAAPIKRKLKNSR